jgi:hypothetical protein
MSHFRTESDAITGTNEIVEMTEQEIAKLRNEFNSLEAQELEKEIAKVKAYNALLELGLDPKVFGLSIDKTQVEHLTDAVE